METIKLQEIVGYLPWGVKFYVFDHPSFEAKYLTEYPNGNSRVELTIENFKEKLFKDRYKPILHSIESLTEFREDLGFVPIVELARIAFGKLNEYTISETRNEIITCLNSSMYNKASFKTFSFSNGSFYSEITNSKLSVLGYITIKNQQELFQKLHEWHIDIYNLIPRNLAIDIKTLK